MISDKEIQEAVDDIEYVRDNIGPTKAAAVRDSHMVKHIEALEKKKYNQLAAAKAETEARASDAYKHALEQDAASAGKLEEMRAIQNSAELIVSVWQSQIKQQQGNRP